MYKRSNVWRIRLELQSSNVYPRVIINIFHRMLVINQVTENCLSLRAMIVLGKCLQKAGDMAEY